MEPTLDDLSRLRAGDPEPAQADPQADVSAILKVDEPGYVPGAVRVRSRIDPYVFTADIPAGALSDVKSDPHVKLVSEAEILPLIDTRPADEPAA